MADNQQQKESLSHESYQTIEENMADNRVDNHAMLADNMPNLEVLLPDNVAETESLLADGIEIPADLAADVEDNQIDNFLKDPIPDKLSIEELGKRYQIKRATLYERLKYLKIKSWREGRNAYLNAEQIAHLDSLYKHMKKNTMGTYPIPRTTETEEKEEQQTLPIQNFSTDKLEISDGAITLQQSSIQQSNINQELANNYEPELQVIKPSIGEVQLGEMDMEAQYLAASRVVGPQELADYYESTGNFTIPEIIQIIEQRREKTAQQWKAKHAAFHPKHVTQLLIERAKARKVVGMQNQAQPAS